MPILTKLKQYLDENAVQYEVLSHRLAYTAQEVAAAQHVKGREFAKVVMAKAGDGFVMAVLPAMEKLDTGKLARAAGGAQVQLATEQEFERLFPNCDAGAMPPFGNLFGLPVYVDQSLTKDETIVFQAGTHLDTVRMSFDDFARLVAPVVGDLALRREEV